MIDPHETAILTPEDKTTIYAIHSLGKDHPVIKGLLDWLNEDREAAIKDVIHASLNCDEKVLRACAAELGVIDSFVNTLRTAAEEGVKD